MSSLTHSSTANAGELAKKKIELAELEQELAENELLLSTDQAELRLFETNYNQRVGTKYNDLEEVKALIYELASRLFPQQEEEYQSQARTAREQAGPHAPEGEETVPPPVPEKFTVSQEIRKLFREVARKIHPDLATDPGERDRRHDLMARLNKAYEERDEEKIREVLRDWEEGRPDENYLDAGELLSRILKKIGQVRMRLASIQEEIGCLRNSEVYRLKEKIEAAEVLGHDILEEMAAEVEEKINAVKHRVRRLAHDVTLE